METVSQVAENQELTQEQISNHEAEMIAKAESAEANSLAKDSNQFDDGGEQLLAGKYKTPEELEKAYKELEAKLGKPKEEADETKQGVEEAGKETLQEAPKTPEEAKELADSKGIDYDALNQEYLENGGLTEDTYKNLESKGLTRDVVDAYIAGQNALAQQEVAKLQSVVGGEQEFNAMVEWATENLTDQEKAVFNDSIMRKGSAEFAVKGLYARYKAEAEPTFVSGNSPVATSGNVYSSQREMMMDMASPRYRTDPAFRQQVADKVARSKF